MRFDSGSTTSADILNQPTLPVVQPQRTYRTHPDKLAPYWNEVEEFLKNASQLKAYVLFAEMAKRHPEAFEPSWQRTIERRVRDWKLEQRVEKDVTFDQVHEPGDVLTVDCTNMNELGVIIANQKFDHMLFHAALTYSNWEYIDLCFSESFEALAQGIQGCFQAIGGVPQHWTYHHSRYSSGRWPRVFLSALSSKNAGECFFSNFTN